MSDALHILKKIAKEGEITLSDALLLSKRRFNNHKDQYPLSLLIEDGYLGITLNQTPPTGAENMREYTLATGLHMFGLKPDSEGVIHYEGIKSSGNVKPDSERVFIKAKGLLFVSELRDRELQRLASFLTGFLAAFLAQYLVELLKP